MVVEQAIWLSNAVVLSVLALSSRFDGLSIGRSRRRPASFFQYSLCRVVLMVKAGLFKLLAEWPLSVLALSSRFDGHECGIVVAGIDQQLSVLALSSRFDGPTLWMAEDFRKKAFSTRSVESF